MAFFKKLVAPKEPNKEQNEEETEQVPLGKLMLNKIGMDVSSIGISLPVGYFEPTTLLQRMCETMATCDLLDKASEAETAIERLMYVTAFACTGYIGSERYQKPFNPLLGETFEYLHKPNGMKFLAEQVSHHPPIGAAHCFNDNFTLYQQAEIKTKFLGNTIELTTAGKTHIILPKTDDHFYYGCLKSRVNNLLLGKTWVDHFGTLEIRNINNGQYSSITFEKCGWMSKGYHQFHGYVKDQNHNPCFKISGEWNGSVNVEWLIKKNDINDIKVNNNNQINGKINENPEFHIEDITNVEIQNEHENDNENEKENQIENENENQIANESENNEQLKENVEENESENNEQLKENVEVLEQNEESSNNNDNDNNNNENENKSNNDMNDNKNRDQDLIQYIKEGSPTQTESVFSLPQDWWVGEGKTKITKFCLGLNEELNPEEKESLIVTDSRFRPDRYHWQLNHKPEATKFKNLLEERQRADRKTRGQNQWTPNWFKLVPEHPLVTQFIEKNNQNPNNDELKPESDPTLIWTYQQQYWPQKEKKSQLLQQNNIQEANELLYPESVKNSACNFLSYS